MSGLANDRSDDTVQNLILDLVEWVGRNGRSYQETMDAWRTSCPRLPVWEEATERGLVEAAAANDGWLVRATPAGLAFLEERRPQRYERLPPRSDV
jgi:D-3-phosphoglycerate dehydrogenase